MVVRVSAMPLRRCAGDVRGAVFVEQIIAFLPVIFFSLAVWQLIELCVGHLVVQRAASAAARAAIVVLPDDGTFYDKAQLHEYTGERQTDIELAAALILATNAHFQKRPVVTVEGAAGKAGIRATNRPSLGAKLRSVLGVATGAKGPAEVLTEGEHELGPHSPLTVTVSAQFECFAAWVNLVCAGSSRTLSAKVTYPYQGASYTY